MRDLSKFLSGSAGSYMLALTLASTITLSQPGLAQAQSGSRDIPSASRYADHEELRNSSYRRGLSRWIDFYFDTGTGTCYTQSWTRYGASYLYSSGSRVVDNTLCRRPVPGTIGDLTDVFRVRLSTGLESCERRARAADRTYNPARCNEVFDLYFDLNNSYHYPSDLSNELEAILCRRVPTFQECSGGTPGPAIPSQDAALFSKHAIADRIPVSEIVSGPDNTPNGTRDVANEHPNVVRLAMTDSQGRTFTCTGTLINSRQILTAHHCFSTTAGVNDAMLVEVGFGNGSSRPNIITGGTVSLHAGFEHSSWSNDLAIVTLDAPAIGITPATLVSPDTLVAIGDRVTLVGYGANGDGVNPYNGLDGWRRVGVNTLDAYEYYTNVMGHFYGPLGAASVASSTGTPPMLWLDLDGPNGDQGLTGGPAIPGEVGGAPGDSGGPLFIETEFGFVQIGVLTGGLWPGSQSWDYGTLTSFQSVVDFLPWINDLSPFRGAAILAGDGDWTDPTRWADGFVPLNGDTTLRPDGLPLFYNVMLDEAGRTSLAGLASAETVYIGPDAGLDIQTDGRLEVAAEAVLDGGSLTVDGALISRAMIMLDGQMTISPTGGYFDASSFTDLGFEMHGGSLGVEGTLFTDTLWQTGGSTVIGETGLVQDYSGAALHGGSFTLNGRMVSAGLSVVESYFHIGETGHFFSPLSLDAAIGGLIFVDGRFQSAQLFMVESTLGGDGVIETAMGVYQSGGVLEMYDWVSPTQSLDIIGGYSLLEGLANFGIGAEGNDIVRVDGDATLTGDLVFNFHNGHRVMRGDRFTFATATGAMNMDLNLLNADPSPLLSFQLGQDGKSAYMDVIGASYLPFADTDQQRALARALDEHVETAPLTGDFADLVMALDYSPTGDDLRTALQTLNPSDTLIMETLLNSVAGDAGDTARLRGQLFARHEQAGSDMAWSPRRTTRLAALGSQSDVLTSALLAATTQPEPRRHRLDARTGVYMLAQSSWGERDLPNGAMDTEGKMYAMGLDHEITSEIMLGGMIAFAEQEGERDFTRIRAEGMTLTAYAALRRDSFFASGYLGSGEFDLDQDRLVTVGADFAMRSTSQADMWMSGLEMGFSLDSGDTDWGPLLNVQHAATDIAAHDEEGLDLFAAQLDARTADETLIGAGGFAAHEAEFDWGAIQVSAQALWQHEVSDGDNPVTAQLGGARGAAFPVFTDGQDREFGTVTAAIDLSRGDNLTITARMSTDFARADHEESAAQLAVSWRF